MVGTKIHNYTLKRIIGRGGQGVVYEATHEYLSRPAAIKVLDIPCSDNSSERAFREAVTASELNHPGIVTIFDCAYVYPVSGFAPESPRLPCIIMEKVTGITLRERLHRGTLSVRETLFVARLLAEALAVTHRHNIVHLDLKPENIFTIEDNGAISEVKLVDFGIAKFVNSKMDSNTSLSPYGTFAYMAPERLHTHQDISPAMDLYALGCVIYEMLAGEPPFGRVENRPIGLDRTPRPLRTLSLAVNIPDSLDRTVLQLLRSHPDDRIQTCKALIDRLDTLQVGAVKAQRVGALITSLDPTWLALALAIFGLLLIGASMTMGVSKDFCTRPNWGLQFLIVLPIAVFFLAVAVRYSCRAVQMAAKQNGVELHHDRLVIALGRAGIVGLIMAVPTATLTVLRWWRNYQSGGTGWSTEAPVLGVLSHIGEGLMASLISTLFLCITASFFTIRAIGRDLEGRRCHTGAWERLGVLCRIAETAVLGLLVGGVVLYLALSLSNISRVASTLEVPIGELLTPTLVASWFRSPEMLVELALSGNIPTIVICEAALVCIAVAVVNMRVAQKKLSWPTWPVRGLSPKKILACLCLMGVCFPFYPISMVLAPIVACYGALSYWRSS